LPWGNIADALINTGGGKKDTPSPESAPTDRRHLERGVSIDMQNMVAIYFVQRSA